MGGGGDMYVGKGRGNYGVDNMTRNACPIGIKAAVFYSVEQRCT